MSYDEDARLIGKRFWLTSCTQQLHIRDACRPVSRLCILPSYNLSDLISYTDFLIERFVVQLPYNAIYLMKKAISTLQCFVIPTALYATYFSLTFVGVVLTHP
ncbi:hypothetical protein AVEN_38510-1 [Araneus ventricosus]|uniref:Uncharacterized protein n=1 Tax=Araneus ventricosus TaxID=182803 RepID=A0A4Y2QI53_ARAVE|nr:hypothetical protein AVEN_38510-1 [Araneus ventricosus]